MCLSRYLTDLCPEYRLSSQSIWMLACLQELTFDPKNKPDVTLKYRATITGTWTTFEAGVVEALTAHHILGPDFLEK